MIGDVWRNRFFGWGVHWRLAGGVVAVYNFGARAKIGGTPAVDSLTRIGSETAADKFVRIGSESA